jgi:DNA-binding transcriptional regulator GbsR (MarR family)
MKGYAREDDDVEGVGTLSPWESLVVDAVGNVIDFWNFKRNQGRVWALLYLRGKALSASEIQETLGLSKGGVSMLVRELEQWSVVRRVRAPKDDTWRYAAETDLMKMIGRVIAERESGLVKSVREDLEHAVDMAEDDDDLDPEVLARLKRMRTLAALVDEGLQAFLRTQRFDAGAAFLVLQGGDHKSATKDKKNDRKRR